MIGNRRKRLRETLAIRARVIQAIRKFFIDHDYLEIETPIRIPAPAPEAHIDAVASEDWYLQTSPELCMKRLLAAGFPRIFQICRCFRRAERGDRHLPEMTMLEWYRADSDYQEIMQECEALIRAIALDTGAQDVLSYQGRQIELTPPWPRLSVEQAFEQYGTISSLTAMERNRFDDIMVEKIEPNLGHTRPLFLYDYPAARGALARLRPGDCRYAERFELYIGGLEICNAFSELTDPSEQRERFERERNQRLAAGKPLYPMPEKFLRALKDMPAAAGNALGIDRLVMLFSDSTQIDEVVAFTPEEI
jgi:lysyl-tRNA synthetase class 2